ncbi:MAG: hypothetical protein V1926_00865 [Candidatus Peregrinibacteria bacterium]
MFESLGLGGSRRGVRRHITLGDLAEARCDGEAAARRLADERLRQIVREEIEAALRKYGVIPPRSDDATGTEPPKDN